MIGVKSIFDTAPVTAVIGVDTEAETISVYVDRGDRREVRQVVSYRCAPFSEEFYKILDATIKRCQQADPSASMEKLTFVLSDQNILMDTIHVPMLNRRAMENALDAAIGAIYKNKKELHYRTYPLSQNRQFATFGLVGVRKVILDRLVAVCAANHIGIQGVTFASGAMVCGAMVLNPKLKNGTFLLLDIKKNSAQFAFVNKGRVIGTYRLPFGDAILNKSQLISEELPTDQEGIIYENFRIFLKWTLELLANNPAITAQGAIDTVYVNMAKEYDFLFERLGVEEAENGVKFAPLLSGNGYGKLTADACALELYGAFQLKQFNKLNNF